MSLADSIRDNLVKVFALPQAEVLSHCVVQAHDTLATSSDMHDLRVALTELTQLEELRRVDLIATGRVATGRVARGRIVSGEVETAELYLVGDVSFKAHNDDVLRASRRAALLRKAGFAAQAFVACKAVDDCVAALAQRDDVWIIVKGRLLSPAA